MKIYDISQPILGCNVYPGDPIPEKTSIKEMENGDLYNLSSVNMCVHNGTHIDAPRHFIKDGNNVEDICLDKFIGFAYVTEHNGEVTAKDAISIIEKARECDVRAAKRILFKGNVVVTAEAARVFAEAELHLLGNESQSVGPENAPMEVHLILLSSEVVLLEGIRLDKVQEGVYFLNAAPINLNGCEGAPCRAVLVDLE